MCDDLVDRTESIWEAAETPDEHGVSFLEVEAERILTHWEALEGEPSGKLTREVALLPEIGQLLGDFAQAIKEIWQFHRTLGTDLTEWDKTERSFQRSVACDGVEQWGRIAVSVQGAARRNFGLRDVRGARLPSRHLKRCRNLPREADLPDARFMASPTSAATPRNLPRLLKEAEGEVEVERSPGHGKGVDRVEHR